MVLHNFYFLSRILKIVNDVKAYNSNTASLITQEALPISDFVLYAFD